MALLTVAETKNWLSKGGLIIDLRSIDSFMDGFIPGSVYMPYSDNFYSVLDTLCETEDAIILVSENPVQQAEIEKRLTALPSDSIKGFLKEGFSDWAKTETIDLIIGIEADEFAMDYQYDEFVLIDLRSKELYEQEHIEDSENVLPEELLTYLLELDEEQIYYLYGNNAHETLNAASLFKRAGFQRVRPVLADYETIKNLGFPITKAKKQK